MRLQAYDDNGTMKFRQVSGSQALDSLPVGTTIGYVGGVIPNGYLEADGSTFDTAKYPELYSKLGSNTLPELFDHSSQIRYDLASSFSSSVWYTAPKDGVILGNCQGPFTNAFSIYLRAPGGTTNISARQLMLYNDYNSNTWGSGSSLPISKGWQVYVESEDASTCYFAPYDKHLLIKAATIGISDVSINAVKTALTPSKIEELGTMSGHTSLANAIEMPYSGLLAYNWSTANSSATSHTLHIVYDDGTESTIAMASISYSADSRTFAVQKGWKIYCSNNEPARAVARIQKLFI